jgi:uncharacterized membrane protein
MRYLYLPVIVHYDVSSCLSYPAIATVYPITLAAENSEEELGKTSYIYIKYEHNEGFSLFRDVIPKTKTKKIT